MASLTKTGVCFPRRAIVDRERAKGSYALGPYLLSKLLLRSRWSGISVTIWNHSIPHGSSSSSNIFQVWKVLWNRNDGVLSASAMGLLVGAMVPTIEATMALGPSLITVLLCLEAIMSMQKTRRLSSFGFHVFLS
ncbi:ABC transporter G family member 7 [Camellia lanceoleosa]|uniref:ABC transporter G family member 7 n=1 Tax=Camellia lanceoleosa TaxID=1840588 RepID=A0ACC0FMK2_9ERIC|nr:ABC transporter G family member 7 [Camellia lanceoleosa]